MQHHSQISPKLVGQFLSLSAPRSPRSCVTETGTLTWTVHCPSQTADSSPRWSRIRWATVAPPSGQPVLPSVARRENFASIPATERRLARKRPRRLGTAADPPAASHSGLGRSSASAADQNRSRRESPRAYSRGELDWRRQLTRAAPEARCVAMATTAALPVTAAGSVSRSSHDCSEEPVTGGLTATAPAVTGEDWRQATVAMETEWGSGRRPSSRHTAERTSRRDCGWEMTASSVEIYRVWLRATSPMWFYSYEVTATRRVLENNSNISYTFLVSSTTLVGILPNTGFSKSRKNIGEELRSGQGNCFWFSFFRKVNGFGCRLSFHTLPHNKPAKHLFGSTRVSRIEVGDQCILHRSYVDTQVPMQGRRNRGGGGAEGSCPSNFGEILALALWRCMDINELKSALAPPTLEPFLRPCTNTYLTGRYQLRKV